MARLAYNTYSSDVSAGGKSAVRGPVQRRVFVPRVHQNH